MGAQFGTSVKALITDESQSPMTLKPDSKHPRYGICITNFNSTSTIRKSLDSVLCQVDERFEVIVVDSLSTDDSIDYLRGLSNEGRIKLIERKTSRGQGRQLALENSCAPWVIQRIDMDDVYKPKLTAILDFYHKATEGTLLVLREGSAMISPRFFATSIGWRNVQYGEDWDYWRRAATAGKLVYLDYDLRSWGLRHGTGSLLERFKGGYEMERDLFRLGRSPWRKIGDSSTLGRKAVLASLLFPAYMSSKWHGKLFDDKGDSFRLADYTWSSAIENVRMDFGLD